METGTSGVQGLGCIQVDDFHGKAKISEVISSDPQLDTEIG
jgi:hypothetical protein